MRSIVDNRLELVSRDTAGVHVQLLWNPQDDALAVRIVDARTAERREFAVAAGEALDAFRRPFAYAHAA